MEQPRKIFRICFENPIFMTQCRGAGFYSSWVRLDFTNEESRLVRMNDIRDFEKIFGLMKELDRGSCPNEPSGLTSEVRMKK